MFSVPFATYHAARYQYFALPFSLPYYAKVADRATVSLRSGWQYLGVWAVDLGWGFLLPVLFAAAAPSRERRGPARALCAGFVLTTVSFCVVSRGDWMAGFRWFSLLSVPLAVLYATGVAEITARLPRTLAPRAFAGAVAVPIVWNLVYLGIYSWAPEHLTVESTGARVRYLSELAASIHLDRPWVTVDHVQGGEMWWGPPHGRAIDPYGLTDTVFALHRSDKNLVHSYLLDPPTFDFAHAKEDKLRKSPTFLKSYVPLPKVAGRCWDDWIARALLTAPAWPGGTPTVAAFAGNPRLEGLAVRSPEVSTTTGLYVELGLRRPAGSRSDFAVKVFLSGPATTVFDAPPGYGGLLPPDQWRPDEVFVGRYVFALPPDLPLGDYAVGVALVDPAGTVEPALTVTSGEVVADGAVVGPGEVRLPTTVRVVSAADAAGYAEADWKRAEALAGAGACAEADEAWRDALEHEPARASWADELHARAKVPLADCWAAQAAGEPELAAQLEDLRRARLWDVRAPAALAVGSTIAEATWPQAEAARAAGDAKEALRLFQAVVTADPRRSWARRYAEEARGELLRGGRAAGARPLTPP